MKTIKRNFYLEKLINSKDHDMIKIITGIKGCGKSFLLFNLYYKYLLSVGVKEDQIIKIALDDETNIDYRDPLKLYHYIDNLIIDKDKRYYVFIDEAQLAIADKEREERDYIEIYGVLNGLLHKKNVDTYITCSNSDLLATDVQTYFRGRGEVIHVWPLSFAEFMMEYEGDKRSGFKEYSTYGGMPLVLSMNSDEEKRKYLFNLLENTYKKEFIERYYSRDDEIFDDVVDILASSIGSLTNPNMLTNTFVSKGLKVDNEIILLHLKYLKDSSLISESKRYSIKRKRHFGDLMKYYFVDMGLRNASLNFNKTEEILTLENIVYNELLVRGYDVDVGFVEYKKWNKKDRVFTLELEIDFVCERIDEKIYIQVAYVIPDRETMKEMEIPFSKIKDNFKKMIIVKNNLLSHYNENGYYIMNIYDFLLNPNSLSF